MKILVVSGFLADSNYAYAINTVKMAQGFANCGHKVTLLCRQGQNGIVSQNKFDENFGTKGALGLKQLSRNIGESWRFTLAGLPFLFRFKPDLVYGRNYIFPAVASRLGFATAAESHAHPDNVSRQFMTFVKGTRNRKFLMWVSISKHLAAHYQSLGVPPEKLMVLPDAVDLDLFSPPEMKTESPYSQTGPHVVYAGHLYDYKGIPTILDCAGRCPQARFHLVGGTPVDIARQKDRVAKSGLSNVEIHGHVPHTKLAPYLWHADILLLPPGADHPSAKWTSPVKLGEYLASGRPVVATAIPALKDWLTDREVCFIPPDDPEAMCAAISRLKQDREYADGLCENGREMAQGLSYTNRAQRILNKLKMGG